MKKKTTTTVTVAKTFTTNIIINEDFLKITKETTNSLNECEETTYPLREVSLEELFSLRVKEKAGFVFKKQNRYFYSEIPVDLTLSCAKIFKHLCASSYEICGNFSSSPTRGCKKVLDLSVTSCQFKQSDRKTAVEIAQRIEKYPFIEEGFETFNVTEECFVVLKCKNHK